ncbi:MULTISPECIES: GDP-mannose pyrophosphatase NudK [Pseudomonas]|uniref:GDP-mannose pyrophosphatase n=1 Tax=Pseudomonas lini TaxID=163011 RepID=A0A0J6JYQ8_9PSED|nr:MULTISPECIES: GDP-mannose pyrophosphatase NudK [Pseudomonas]KAB0499314.1 GDP-mannose pyrophosphatase NudK [Pseudomonas lini]KMM88942.1 GDP-mannose pyrophosphatase [Pseudomonas lini]KNH44778.1 GDP-mannose pyrophosphatase [Pseudomonas lini]MCO8309789.1 GDP-mannose pyrophosphatase NudK [Pseudomonas mandelii]MDT9675900.1 GDP-mannose pyrophosphatase NudK [Pseudomonas sp. JV414]
MNQAIATKDRVRIKQVEVLSDNWYVLRKTTYDFQGRDGTWRNMSRETYDRGNGATILLYSKLKQTVVLTRQFRFPAFVNEHDGMLIETCAGLLDRDDPHTCIRKETEEETGYRIKDVRKIFEAFMSPGSVTERLYFFVGEYFDEDKLGEGGGVEAEGEEVEVLELPLDEALAMIETGAISDGKTIMLLQYAKLHRLLE